MVTVRWISGVRQARSFFCRPAAPPSSERASRWTTLAGEFTCQTSKEIKSLSIAPRGRYCIPFSDNAGICARSSSRAVQKERFLCDKKDRACLRHARGGSGPNTQRLPCRYHPLFAESQTNGKLKVWRLSAAVTGPRGQRAQGLTGTAMSTG